MSKNGTTAVATRKAVVKKPRSATLAELGVNTSGDFANLMSALMSDLITGRIPPNVGNATCNAGGKLLRIVEMQFKYGTEGSGTGKKVLTLTATAAE